MRIHAAVLAFMVAFPALGHAAPTAPPTLQVELSAAAGNPASPQMGDRLGYQSTIRNTGAAPLKNIIAWLGLIQVDKGQEQPVDLEDWSAHKAVTIPSLAPGQTVQTEWPMRLIASGHYRVVVSVASGSGELVPSPFADLIVRAKAVVQSTRVLPVALAIPLLLLAGLLLRRRQGWGVPA